MLFIVEHPAFIFFLFLIPLLGWSMQKYLSKKSILIGLFSSLVLLLPVLAQYSYVWENASAVLIYVFFICGYAWIVTVGGYKFRPTLVLSAAILLIGGFYAFIGFMGGKITVENEWKVKGYKIVYVRNQGFSGRPLMTYQLSKYAVVPFFLKKIEEKVDDGQTNNCWVKFEEAGFHFSRCDTDSSYILQKHD